MENFIFCAVIPLYELIETNGGNFTYISTSFNIRHLKSQYQVITARKEQGTNNYSALYCSCTPELISPPKKFNTTLPKIPFPIQFNQKTLI